jgi:hypothetical protein
VIARRAALVLLLALAGCSDADRCDGALLDALYLEVIDATTGEPIEAMVTVIFEGDSIGVTCTRRLTSGEPCLTWAAGPMLHGTFEVSITAAGHEPTTATIEVSPGECGPISVERTFALDPSAPPP